MPFIFILKVFTFVLIDSSENQTCICKFPFIYKNNTYNACTKIESASFWCGAQVDLGWGYCDLSNCPSASSSKVHQNSNTNSDANKEDFDSSENQTCICKFPFIYEGNTYNACTKENNEYFWCATQVNNETDHMLKHGWGICDLTNCPASSKVHQNYNTNPDANEEDSKITREVLDIASVELEGFNVTELLLRENGKITKFPWFSGTKFWLIISLTSFFGFVVLITIGIVVLLWQRQKKNQKENQEERIICLFETVSSIDHIKKDVPNVDSKTIKIGNLIGTFNT